MFTEIKREVSFLFGRLSCLLQSYFRSYCQRAQCCSQSQVRNGLLLSIAIAILLIAKCFSFQTVNSFRINQKSLLKMQSDVQPCSCHCPSTPLLVFAQFRFVGFVNIGYGFISKRLKTNRANSLFPSRTWDLPPQPLPICDDNIVNSTSLEFKHFFLYNLIKKKPPRPHI